MPNLPKMKTASAAPAAPAATPALPERKTCAECWRWVFPEQVKDAATGVTTLRCPGCLRPWREKQS